MRCPKCQFEQDDQQAECRRCGLIFEKYRQFQAAPKQQRLVSDNHQKAGNRFWEIANSVFGYVKPESNLIVFGGRVLFFVIMLIWGLKFILTPLESNYTGESFWHLVNLPFHEAGHIVFRPFGRFMTSLGGSLGQLLMPLICCAVFLVKTRDTFAASFALWWFGENFMDLAPYINDARSLTLPLLGGNIGHSAPYGFHDWEFILKEAGLIRYDHLLAQLAHGVGSLLMLMALAWGGYILMRQFKTLRPRPG